ncbi:glutamate--cysteine ligase [Castellaniella sp.]|uniref:glutamate--cysteine ligase n=1 Tax=Castellaniella sp. TaxID=1955812 RepID=UPI003C75E805
MTQASQRRSLLSAHPELLLGIRRGIEKEGLRVDGEGTLAKTPHPVALGAALTHPHITTDYSESLLELVTSPLPSTEELVGQLRDIHTFVALRNPNEAIWNQSMPCHLPAEADIPVAWYGTSNTGMLKHVYRQGLAWRYGKVMQCIAGVHYNFSLPEAAWDFLTTGDTAQARRNTGYMGLIRNFMRHSWLLMYLFGASPAMSRSFLQRTGLESHLSKLSPDTYCLPWATSLRMSDLGYKNPSQSELHLCYNDLDTFTARIHTAVTTPWPAYEAIGTHRDGQRIQLNTNILQIENEYYATIRPKQTAGRCERPNTILHQRGIQYIEVRCMDIDPWEPAGIAEDTCRFLDAFLLFCALEDSPMFPAPGTCQESQGNFATVAREGRRPGLQLSREGQSIALSDWAAETLARIAPYAALLDEQTTRTAHQASIQAQLAKVKDVSLTPSARLLTALQDSGQEFHQWTLAQSQAHWAALQARGLSAQTLAQYDKAAQDSLAEQAELEAAPAESFENYVVRFHAALLAA